MKLFPAIHIKIVIVFVYERNNANIYLLSVVYIIYTPPTSLTERNRQFVLKSTSLS